VRTALRQAAAIAAIDGAFLVPWLPSLPSLYFDATLLTFAWCMVALGILAVLARSKENREDKKSTGQEVRDAGKTAS